MRQRAASNGAVLYRSDLEKEGTSGWTVLRGAWGVKDGVLQETSLHPQCAATFGNTNWDNYAITLRARRTGGEEGFNIYFNWLSLNNWTFFNVGGWTNTAAGIQDNANGSWALLCDRAPCHIDVNVWYDVRVVLNGDHIECYLDSKLIQEAVYSPPVPASPEAANPNAGTAAQTQLPQLKRFPLFSPALRGAIGVGARNTRVEFANIAVTRDNTVLYRSDFSRPDAAGGWSPTSGNWDVTNGVFRQSQIAESCFATHGDTNWADYTLTLRARKLAGAEGFCVVFGRLDDDNYMVFNAGGNGNQTAGIEENIRGRYFNVMTEPAPLVIESNVWYDVKVVLSGVRVACYVNSNLVQTAVAQLPFATNAVFEGATTGPDGQVLQFRVGNQSFSASLRKDRGWPVSLQPGSLVQVNGQIELENEPGIDGQCDVELFSPDDVVLLQPPSWWTWQRIVGIGGGFFAVLLIAIVWSAMIWRRNRLLTIAQRQLKTANDELESRVRARTADLAKANVELKQEQALFRALLDNASDLIYFKDVQSRFVRCSVALCNWSALRHDQIVGKTDFDIHREDQARGFFEDEQAIIRTGQPLIGQLEKTVHPDGRVDWVLTTKMPWRDPDGNIIGTFGISKDITPIKEAEAKLKEVHHQLLEISRQAGMAEVATNVLHNVGNVLNSVNISASLLLDKTNESQIPNLVKAVALFEAHDTDLGAFITTDAKGRELPGYFGLLAEQLSKEQQNAIVELKLLRQNIEHIKEIVTMQQNYANISGILETVKVTDLVEEALAMNLGELGGHQVELVRQFQDVPPVMVEKHKVLQILVNLIRNAKYACDESGRKEKRLKLAVSPSEGGVRVAVIDNGIGIPPENLTRIFNHGFTTKKNGHGFGLHSGALAAKAIGGSLTAHSDGTGQGATFVLNLPFQPPKPAA